MKHTQTTFPGEERRDSSRGSHRDDLIEETFVVFVFQLRWYRAAQMCMGIESPKVSKAEAASCQIGLTPYIIRVSIGLICGANMLLLVLASAVFALH